MHPLNNNDGAIAQLVEQRTENPCVPGSIPGGTTENERVTKVALFSFTLKNAIFSPIFKLRLNQFVNQNVIVFQKVCKFRIDYFCNAIFKNE